MADQSVSLVEFIRAAKEKGAGDEFVVDLLRSRGWSEKRILDAFAAFYEAETGVGVPSRGGRVEAARDAFLHLLSFIALGTWTCSLGSLLYSVIDHYIPPLNAPPYSLPTRTSVSFEMAGILVAFPLYLLVMRGMAKAAAANPERLQSGVRKWLTYIALLIAAGTLLGDVVTFLAWLLRGDLTTRFVLQVLTLAVLAGGVMRYYLTTLRDETPPAGHNRIFACVATIAVVLGLGLGLTLSGSPVKQPALARDERRLQDLAMITQDVAERWNTCCRRVSLTLPRERRSRSIPRTPLPDNATSTSPARERTTRCARSSKNQRPARCGRQQAGATAKGGRASSSMPWSPRTIRAGSRRQAVSSTTIVSIGSRSVCGKPNRS
jgi:hypothetical protein